MHEATPLLQRAFANFLIGPARMQTGSITSPMTLVVLAEKTTTWRARAHESDADTAATRAKAASSSFGTTQA
jgi:hypothetical protein